MSVEKIKCPVCGCEEGELYVSEVGNFTAFTCYAACKLSITQENGYRRAADLVADLERSKRECVCHSLKRKTVALKQAIEIFEA